MVRLRRAFVVAVVVVAATMMVRVPEARQVNAADTIISAPTAISVSTPLTPTKTLAAIGRALFYAHVPYGIEGPPTVELPTIDLAETRLEIADLRGMSVGSALSAIARLDSSVKWSEHGGVIDVRLTPGRTWLDQELPAFAVSKASPIQALDALLSTADPARHGHVEAATSMVNLAQPSPFTFVTISHERGTVLDALDDLVRSTHGTWRVSYGGAAVDANDASVTFAPTSPESVTSRAPAATVAHPDADLVEATIGNGIETAIFDFARGAHLLVGIETVDSPRVPLPQAGIVLWLDRRQPRESLERVLQYDSRYALFEEHGMFHVRPKAGSIVPALDKALLNFSANDEPFDVILRRLVWNAIAPQQRSSQDVFSTRLSMTADASTIREALDTLCRSIDASWLVNPQGGSVWLEVRAPGRAMGTSTPWRTTR